jgi:hypothetical protein
MLDYETGERHRQVVAQTFVGYLRSQVYIIPGIYKLAVCSPQVIARIEYLEQ